MGESFGISAFARGIQNADAAAALFRRLLSLGEVVYFDVFEGQTSITQYKERMNDSFDFREPMHLAIGTIRRVEACLSCLSPYGESEAIDVQFFGCNEVSKEWVEFTGPLRVGMRVVRPPGSGITLIEDPIAGTIALDSAYLDPSYVFRPARIDDDMSRYYESVFQKACGVAGDNDAHQETLGEQILTAYFHLCYEVPMPCDCGFVYHREPREFLRDLGRIYASLHWGTLVATTLVDEWDLEKLRLEHPQIDPGLTRKDFDLEGKQGEWRKTALCLRKMRDFARDRVDAICALENDEAQAALQRMMASAESVELCSLENDGIILKNRPDGGLWNAYCRLYDAALEIASKS